VGTDHEGKRFGRLSLPLHRDVADGEACDGENLTVDRVSQSFQRVLDILSRTLQGRIMLHIVRYARDRHHVLLETSSEVILLTGRRR
jgi:hypothetical protein